MEVLRLLKIFLSCLVDEKSLSKILRVVLLRQDGKKNITYFRKIASSLFFHLVIRLHTFSKKDVCSGTLSFVAFHSIILALKITWNLLTRQEENNIPNFLEYSRHYVQCLFLIFY